MILNDDGKREFLQSNFHQYFDIELHTHIDKDSIIQFVNFVLPLSLIDEKYSLEELQKFFNDEYNNVIFTSANDESNIYQYEYYRGNYFIRIKPFDDVIRMHIIPKKYDASNNKTDNNILIFKDNKQNIDSNSFRCTQDYSRDDNGNIINLRYHQSQHQPNSGIYIFNIKEQTKYFNNLQINMGYSYNETNPSPFQLKHYTGIIDKSDIDGTPLNTNELTEWNQSLMDANYDNVSQYTNVSKQQLFDENGIKCPTDTTPYDDRDENHEIGFNNQHETNKLYHKTIKYFNDDIYIEESGKYINQSWKEVH